MIGYIYITTNLINNKKYIGKKVSNKFIPTYLGSGVLIKTAIHKYGKQNFQVNILEECDSREMLINRECYWIKYYNAVNDNMYYNLSYGNEGHAGSGKYKHSEQCKEKISKSNTGKIRTQENKDKISNTLKSYHRHWIHNEEYEVCISENEIDKYISNGYILGRLPMSCQQKKKLSISHKEYISHLPEVERKDKYGHSRGVSCSVDTRNKISRALKHKNTWTRNRVWVHNNNEKHCIKQSDIPIYLKNKYHLGMYKDKCMICSSTTIESIN